MLTAEERKKRKDPSVVASEVRGEAGEREENGGKGETRRGRRRGSGGRNTRGRRNLLRGSEDGSRVWHKWSERGETGR